MKRILWAALGLALALGGCAKKEEAEKAAEPVLSVETATADVKPIRELLAVDGTYVLAPGDFARLAPVTGGKLQQVLVKEGDSVKKGQLLAKIDTRVLDAQKSSASAGSAAAQAQALQSEASLKAAAADYAASVKASELNLQAVQSERDSDVAQAKVDLDKLKAGARPQEISQAEQGVKQAQVNRDKALADANRDKQLLAEGYVSGQQAEASAAAYQVAESALAQAKDQLTIVRLGARTEDLKAAQLKLQAAQDLGDKKVQAARASLDQVRGSKLNLDAKSRETEAARLAAAGKAADSVAARGMAANGEIRAPFDGKVTRRLLNPGDSADPTTPVVEVARTGAKVEFSGQTSAHNGPRLAASMAVLADGATEPSGYVKSVGVPDAQSGQIPVRVVFNGAPEGVSAGVFGRIQVVLRQIPDAVSIPETAVVTRDDKKVVFVVSGDTAKLTEIETGPTENGLIAVTKGLAKGDKVVLVGQHELSDGAKITEAKAEEVKPNDAKPGEAP